MSDRDPNSLGLYTPAPADVELGEADAMLGGLVNDNGAMVYPVFSSVGALSLWTGPGKWVRWRAGDLFENFGDSVRDGGLLVDGCTPWPLAFLPADARSLAADRPRLFETLAAQRHVIPRPAGPEDGEKPLFLPGRPFEWQGIPAFAAERLVAAESVNLGVFEREEDLRAAFPPHAEVEPWVTTAEALVAMILEDIDLGGLALHGSDNVQTFLDRAQLAQIAREGFDVLRPTSVGFGATLVMRKSTDAHVGRPRRNDLHFRLAARRACKRERDVEAAYLVDLQIGDGDPVTTVGVALRPGGDGEAVASAIARELQPRLAEGEALDVVFLGAAELREAAAVGVKLF